MFEGCELPLLFSAQIDLRDVPAFKGRERLPSVGLLFFFQQVRPPAHADVTEPIPSAVLFHPQSKRFEEASPPDDLPTIWSGYRYREWLHGGHSRRSVEFRFPIDFQVIRTFYEGDDPDEPEHEPHKTKELDRVLGLPRPAQFYGARDRVGMPADEFLADPNWPFVWGFIERHAQRPLEAYRNVSRLLTAEPSEDLRKASEALVSRAGSNLSAFREYVENVLAGALHWAELAASHDELEFVPAIEAQRYRDWFSEAWKNAWAWDKVYSSFASESKTDWAKMSLFFANRCVENGQTPPKRWLDQLDEIAGYVYFGTRNSADYRPRPIEMHQVLGHWKSDHCALHESEASDSVLLFQIDGSEQLSFMPGQGCFHFIMSPQDLDRRDFSRVRLYA